MRPKALLLRLNALRNLHDETSVEEKSLILAELGKKHFNSASDLQQFHDVLCFYRAYPNSHALLHTVEDLLSRFSYRQDLHKLREELASSGIAGTPTDYRFFYPMAVWLARHFGQYLHIDWPELDEPERLMEVIPILTSFSENNQFDDFEFSAKQWLQRLKSDAETDAAFFIHRLTTLYKNDIEREALHDKLNIPFRLESGDNTPSSTHAFYPPRKVCLVDSTVRAKRPNLRKAIQNYPVHIRSVSTQQGTTLINLARVAMITHKRDLDAFSYGSASDVRLIDCSDGVQFACIGTDPVRRYLVPAVYGFLNLKNGVPIGYFQVSVLFEAGEISFNTFSNFRGSDAAHIYAKALAMTQRLFSLKTLVLDHYQLGYGNKEGLLSGVWWFYYKLGFRPRNKTILKLVRKELAKMKTNPGYRSDIKTLNSLAEDYMFLELDPKQRNENIFPLSWNIAPAISMYLAKRFGAHREKGLKVCAEQAALKLGLRKIPKLTRDERHAWLGWAPLVVNLPGIERWNTYNRRKLVKIIKAKAGRRESDYIKLMAEHKPLQRAIIKFADQIEF